MANGAARTLRDATIGTGLAFLKHSRIHRLAAPFAAGQGAILMFHHVRPWGGDAFAPNRGLEIEPSFLETTLSLLGRRGIDIVTMDEALARLRQPRPRRFAVLTFDDGYRDNLVHALPILERHAAPFVVYVTTGFADRIAPLWWVDLERALQVLPQVRLPRFNLPCRTPAEKARAFLDLYWSLREQPEESLRAVVRELASAAGIDSSETVDDLCMDWDEIARLARHPLCTIGVHTITHPMLAKHSAELVRLELADSRRMIEERLGRPATHLAYPVGDRTSAGPREFALAAELGFTSAVTTRKGLLFAAHAATPMALPRLSINGGWQDETMLDVLLSGVPFLLWNKGRRVVTD